MEEKGIMGGTPSPEKGADEIKRDYPSGDRVWVDSSVPEDPGICQSACDREVVERTEESVCKSSLKLV